MKWKYYSRLDDESKEEYVFRFGGVSFPKLPLLSLLLAYCILSIGILTSYVGFTSNSLLYIEIISFLDSIAFFIRVFTFAIVVRYIADVISFLLLKRKEFLFVKAIVPNFKFGEVFKRG